MLSSPHELLHFGYSRYCSMSTMLRLHLKKHCLISLPLHLLPEKGIWIWQSTRSTGS